MSSEPADETSPDDHSKFSLGEDWTATIIGLALFTLCMTGVIAPEIIP